MRHCLPSLDQPASSRVHDASPGPALHRTALHALWRPTNSWACFPPPAAPFETPLQRRDQRLTLLCEYCIQASTCFCRRLWGYHGGWPRRILGRVDTGPGSTAVGLTQPHGRGPAAKGPRSLILASSTASGTRVGLGSNRFRARYQTSFGSMIALPCIRPVPAQVFCFSSSGFPTVGSALHKHAGSVPVRLHLPGNVLFLPPRPSSAVSADEYYAVGSIRSLWAPRPTISSLFSLASIVAMPCCMQTEPSSYEYPILDTSVTSTSRGVSSTYGYRYANDCRR